MTPRGGLIALEVLDASARVDGVDTLQLQVNPLARRRATRRGGMTAVYGA